MEEKIKNIIKLYNDGYSYGQIASMLNMSKSTVSFYVKKKDNEDYIKHKENEKKKKEEYESIVCDLARQYNNINQICRLLNKRSTNTNYDLIKKILTKYNIDFSYLTFNNNVSLKHELTKEEIFCENTKLKNNSKLKSKLLKFNLKEPICEKCGNTSWNGESIPLEVHHINGNRTDNRIENLQFLCPNCHTQTDNYCGKNIKKEKNIKIVTKKRISKCPSKEILINDFKNKGSFKQVGSIYEVSDNTVKKWCKKYDLPSSSPEMRKYIINIYGKQPQWFDYMKKRDMSRSIEKVGIKIEIYNAQGEYLTTCASINETSKFTKISVGTLKKYFKGGNIKNKNFIMKKI